MSCTTFARSSRLLSSSSSSRQRLSQRQVQQQQRRLPGQTPVRASASPDNKESPSVFDTLERNAGELFQRYDFLSAGLGALAVTTICVARGQDPLTAMWITGAATVVALLLNEMLFEDGN